MNIIKGESLAYSCAMVKMIRSEISDRIFVVSYDIICKLINHVRPLVDASFVPEMHPTVTMGPVNLNLTQRTYLESDLRKAKTVKEHGRTLFILLPLLLS